MKSSCQNQKVATGAFRLAVGLSLLLTAIHAIAVDAQPAADTKKDQPTPLKPKPDFDPLVLSVVPQRIDKNEANLRFVKPGHWIAATAEAKTNNFDFLGT